MPVALAGGGVVALVVPAAEVELDGDPPIVAFARMKPAVEAPGVLAADPAVVAELSCRHPVTVTVLSSALLLVVALGVCANNAAVVAHAIAAVIHKVRFIYPA